MYIYTYIINIKTIKLLKEHISLLMSSFVLFHIYEMQFSLLEDRIEKTIVIEKNRKNISSDST
jgi:hypothetical protein